MTAAPRVLVLHPPVTALGDYIDYPYFTVLPPLSLAWHLKQRGFYTHLLSAHTFPEASVFELRDEATLFGVPYVALLERLQDADFDVAVVAFSPFHLAQPWDAGLAHLLTQLRRLRPQATLVGAELYSGGMHRTVWPRGQVLLRYPELDAFVWGEGEESISESLESETPLSGEIEASACGVQSLPVFNRNAWEMLDWTRFAAFLQRVGETPKAMHYGISGEVLPVFFSRGCPFHCRFCSSPGHNFRALPLESCLVQMDAALELGVRRLIVLDDAANARTDFKELLEGAAQRGLLLEFPNGLRADLLTRPQLDVLGRCATRLTISAESGSRRVLKEIVGKTVKPEHIQAVAEGCKDVGIPLRIHWMVGFPGETREELLETLLLARRLLDETGAQPLVQYFTPMARTALSQGDSWFDGRLGERMQHEPSMVPEGMDPEELKAAVSLLRSRGDAASSAKVIVNLTYRCNNHCRFCAIGNRIKENLPLETVLEILARYHAQGITQLDLDGGEPSLHPDLLAIVSRAREMGFAPVSVTTNGRRLAYRDFARALLKAGVNNLLFSIHGPTAASHEAETQAPGSFEETMEGLKNVLELRGPGVTVAVNTTLSEGNFRSLPELARQMVELRVDQMNLQFLTPFGRAEAGVVPDPDEAAWVVRQVIADLGHRMKFQVINLPYCHLRGVESHVAQDLGKLSRTMVFVTGEEVNLYRYLAGTRRRNEDCRLCLFQVACDGHYDFSEVWS